MRINNDKTLILNKIKLHYGFKSDAEFARFLGIKANSLSNWYKRNTIDYDLVFTKCEDINLEWLLSSATIDYQNENVEKNISSESVLREEHFEYGDVYWRGRYDQLKEEHERVLKELNDIKRNTNVS